MLSGRRMTLLDDLNWFLANFDAIAKRYLDEWIAVSQGQVVAHAGLVPVLRRQLDAAGIRRALVTRTGERARRAVAGADMTRIAVSHCDMPSVRDPDPEGDGSRCAGSIRRRKAGRNSGGQSVRRWQLLSEIRTASIGILSSGIRTTGSGRPDGRKSRTFA